MMVTTKNKNNFLEEGLGEDNRRNESKLSRERNI